MIILTRLLRSVASVIKWLTWPSTLSGCTWRIFFFFKVMVPPSLSSTAPR